jgi:hypothetical protein
MTVLIPKSAHQTTAIRLRQADNVEITENATIAPSLYSGLSHAVVVVFPKFNTQSAVVTCAMSGMRETRGDAKQTSERCER